MKRLIGIVLTSVLMLSLLVMPSHAASGWSEAYRDYLLNEKFRTEDPDQYDKSLQIAEETAALHDMDNNGVPELIISNGHPHVGFRDNVYTYTDNRVSNVGYLGGGANESENFLMYSTNKNYPGLYLEGGWTGCVDGNYYYVENGIVQNQNVASWNYNDSPADTEVEPDEIYNETLANLFIMPYSDVSLLPMYTLREINAMGWSSFLAKYGFSAQSSPVPPTPSPSNKTYTVRYNSNGGISNDFPAQTKKAGEPLKLNPSIPIGYKGSQVDIDWNMNRKDDKSGYITSAIFTGWNTKPDGTGQTYPAGGTYTSDADVTLYAQWASSFTLRLTPLYTNDGKLFDGWYTSPQGGTKITESTPVAANSTLYAHWKTPDPSANAGANGVHFARRATYKKGQFKDVSSSQWYASNVASAYELGLMKGTSNTTFNPSGDVTIAEALTMASRIHSIYTTGRETFVQSGPNWYQVYVDYANQNGIIDETYNRYYKLGDVTRKATRAEFAMFFASALPDKGLAAINIIYDNAVPDVGNIACSSAVYKLYRAGVLTGSDAKGTFHPTSYITRAEAAAIVDRMAESNDRVVFSLK